MQDGSPDTTTQSATSDEAIARMRADFDQLLPHLVTALKRHDAVADLSKRLDSAEKRLAERQQRPLIAGLRRTLTMVRRLEFNPVAKDAIVAELEGLLVGAGYTEFGEIGEAFDPRRHDAIAGEANRGDGVVAEIFEPGLETLGEIVAPAKVRITSMQ